ncbi:MAG: redox-regulated ATPase YchF [Flavobacteriaceae bacterium]|nr:redox-regulated ATPase YchF [Flavobacteriaceae bacterium]|tara:strand:- start:2538 stop:3632 length:1095 start_codon:yes stop_codon:yes gene_type:complete
MKAGIVGLPNVGKSTLFNCLSNAKAQSANFPFCTIEPNIGIVNVPDDRLNNLSRLINPNQVVPATVEIVDIAGLVKGASKGEGLGNQFLANIRETDAIIHLLRCFDDQNVVHVDGSVDPIRDKETIDVELQLKDLDAIDKKIDKVSRIVRTGSKDAQKELVVLKKVKDGLEKSVNVRGMSFTDDERISFINQLQLITDKPVLYVCNVSENEAIKGNEYVEKVKGLISNENAEILFLAVNTEADINELESFEERKMFLDDIGLDEPGASKLIRKTYKLLNLHTFFTAGPKEVKAWTVSIGALAPQAAGVIHSDFEKGFIRAEVISYNDLINYGSELKVREAGKIRIEGKEYQVRDGDVMHFRFNV